MNRSISFNKEATKIIEKYMQENNCNFNRAVNCLITIREIPKCSCSVGTLINKIQNFFR